jgi:hypothetical protein
MLDKQIWYKLYEESRKRFGTISTSGESGMAPKNLFNAFNSQKS